MTLYTNSFLLLTLAVVIATGFDADKFDKSLRALQTFSELREEGENRRELRGEKGQEKGGMFECKAKGEGCRVVPKCCGDTVCYWANGWSLRADGVCIDCISRDAMCQRDAQCCKGLQCDKTRFFSVDGRCNFPRSTGKCHSDSQCMNTCNKKWYEFGGQCT